MGRTQKYRADGNELAESVEKGTLTILVKREHTSSRAIYNFVGITVVFIFVKQQRVKSIQHEKYCVHGPLGFSNRFIDALAVSSSRVSSK